MAKNFMFTDRTSNSQRRQREDQQVELRRVKNEEILKRKRETVPSKQDVSFMAAREKIFDRSLEVIYQGVYDFRIGLSIESNPPIQAVIDTGVIPRCVQLLDPSFYSDLDMISNNIRVEAAWVLTNICTGTSEQTGEVVRNGAIPFLIGMLKDSMSNVVDQSVWCLGNISGDCEAFRDAVLESGALEHVVSQIKHFTQLITNDSVENIKVLRNLIWLLANLNRGRNPPPKMENMLLSFSMIESVIHLNDPEIASDCFWGASYICDVDSTMTDRVLGSSVMRRCYDLLSGLDNQLSYGGINQNGKICAYAICPIIRVIGNIVTGNEAQTQRVIDFGFLDFFSSIFYKYENKKLPRIRKEICWTLSNISAGSYDQVKSLFDRGLVSLLIDAISNYELYIRKEAIYAILNISHFTVFNTEYLQILLDNKIVTALRHHLEASKNNVEIQMQILDSCKNLLEAGNKLRLNVGENPVIDLMIDDKIVDVIEDLQDSRNNSVSRKAYNLIIDFFDGEDEE